MKVKSFHHLVDIFIEGEEYKKRYDKETYETMCFLLHRFADYLDFMAKELKDDLLSLHN